MADDGSLEVWVTAVILSVTLLGTCCVVWFAWWCIAGRKLRRQQDREAKQEKAAVEAPAFMPLGLRIESEVVCDQEGSRV